MTTPRHSRLIILGSGPAGYSAAVYAARANRKPLLIAGLQPGGQLMTTTEVDNWPGDVDGLLGPDLMDRMRRHAERFGVEIAADQVTSVDLNRAAVPPRRRGRRIHLRCAHHRDRRLRALPRPRVRDGIPRPRRFRLRNLRRLLLPRPQGRGRRRRQHRGRGSDLPHQHRIARHARAPARQAARRGDPAGPPARAGGPGQGVASSGITTSTRSSATSRASRRTPAFDDATAARGPRRHRTLRRDRPHAEHRTLPGPARHEGRLHHREVRNCGRCDGDQRSRRIRRGRRRGSCLSTGGHLRRHRLHGGARRGSLPRARSQPPDPTWTCASSARSPRSMRRSGTRCRGGGAVPAPRIPASRSRIAGARRPTPAGTRGMSCCAHRTARSRAALPLYLKSHSWGEFVFDFAWAEAYQRAGLRYYPRLVAAVPFTPATGPRDSSQR